MQNNREDLCPTKVTRYTAGARVGRVDDIACEAAVTISWNGGENRSELWAWPFSLDYLAAGHALLEQRALGFQSEYTAELLENGGGAQGYFYSVALREEGALRPRPSGLLPLKAESVLRIMEDFIEEEGLWHATGCFHRAGIFSPGEGAMLYATEDIGRHNCVDRLAGWALLNGRDISDCALFISARITATICAKAINAGFRFIASCSAVSSAAVEMAQAHGVTLAGFIRHGEGRLTLYSDPCDNILL